MSEESLYEDADLKITVFPNDPESHEIHILGSKRKYIIERGILREFATTSRKKLESKLDLVNPLILRDAREQGISVEGIGMAIAQAYIEEEERYRREER